MSVVIDLSAVCLICLQHDNNLRNIYAPDDQNPELHIAYKIGRCSNLKLDVENKRMPNKICNTCLMDLKVAWRFRQNCDTAQTIFRTILRDQQQEPEIVPPNKELEVEKINVPQGLEIKRVQQQQTTKNVLRTSITSNDDVEEMISENCLLNKRHLRGKSPESDRDIKFESMRKSDNEDAGNNSADDVVEPYQAEEVFEFYIPEEITPDSSTNNDIRATNTEHTGNNMLVVSDADADEKASTATGSNTPPRKLKITVTSKGNINQATTDEKPIIKQEIPENESSSTQQCSKMRSRNYKPELVTPDTPEDDSTNQSEDNPTPQKEEYEAHARTRKRKAQSTNAKPPKICEICGNSYRYQHALNAHMRRHNDDKQFPCEFCDKAFVSNVELRRHIRVHTGQKPYACQYCDRRFSDFGSRIKHERTHTGERPYHCETCGKAFAYAHVLSVHMRTHTGEKKFRCELCGKGVTKKSYLMAHMKRHALLNEVNNSELLDIKSVALEECILTTEYIDEDEDGDTEIHVLVAAEPSSSENELSQNIR